MGRLVRATGQDQRKNDLNNGRLGLHPYAAIGSPRISIECSEQTIPQRRPLGTEGARIGVGGGRLWGEQTRVQVAPPTITGGAAGLAGRMPASWRGDCPHEREVRISSQRDREAASPTDNATLCDPLFRGEGHRAAGSVATNRIKV